MMQDKKRGRDKHQGGVSDFKATVKKLVLYAKEKKIFFGIAIIFAAFSSILTLVGPNKLAELTDIISAGIESALGGGTSIDFSAIFNIGLLLAIVYLLSYLLAGLQGVIIADIMQKTTKRMRSDIATKINRLPMGYFAKTQKGDILSRVSNDADTLGQTLSQSVGTVISAIVLFAGSLVMMFITNAILAITAVLSTLLGFIFMFIAIGKSQKYFYDQQSELGAVNGYVEEMYTGQIALRAYNAENNAEEEFKKLNDKLKNSAFKAQALSGLMMPMMTFIGNFGYVCICVVGALLALNNVISFGVIVAFMVYIRLFTQPLGQIAQGVQNLQSGIAAAERVFGFLEEKEMDDESSKEFMDIDIKGDVEFKNVSFSYDLGNTIINNFSTKIKAGQKIAIVGPTGAGKSTIVNLLMRFYDAQSGEILIDNVVTNTVQRDSIHSKFSMVLQETWVFNGTLRDNLVYAAENVTDDALQTACKAVGLNHFVKTLPNGYDTVLDDSLQLSQGQKQQITIARAMINNKPMVILDEATSSIDTRTEAVIQEAMDRLMAGRTSFVIAHRLSTIKNADLILVIKDGNVVEQGLHNELLAKKGFYSELYNAQFYNN